MKKSLVVSFLLLAGGIALGSESIVAANPPSATAADVFAPAGSGDSGAVRTAKKGKVLYDSGLVAAGAIINLPVIDTTGIEAISIIATNSDGVATRVFTGRFYLDDGTTQIHSIAYAAVAINSTAIYTVGHAAATGSGGGVTVSTGLVLPTKFSGSLAAGGTSNGRVTVIGR